MSYGLVAAALLLVWSGAARAYTVTVNSFEDDVAAGGSCSVREALARASAVANGCALEGSADEPYVVLLPPGAYNIDGGTLSVNDAVLRGMGPKPSVLWGRFGGGDWLIALSGTAELQRLTLARAPDEDGITAVYATGTASLVDVEIRGFRIASEIQGIGAGGAIGHAPGASVSIRGGRIAACAGLGFAIAGYGEVSIDGVLFEDNRTWRGIALGSSIKIVRSVVRNGVHDFSAGMIRANELEIRDSLFDGNVIFGGGLVGHTTGGVGYVVNSTFVDNVTNVGLFAGELMVESVTAVRNQTGGFLSDTPAFTVRSSIIADNSPADLGAVTSGGFNIIGTGTMTPLPSDRVGIDPGILPFDGRIVPLAADSPARDSGDCNSVALGGPNSTDQIGGPRPWGAGCDVGAAEFRPTPLLLAVTAAAAGACAGEGWLVTAGTDADSSGALEAGEVDATSPPICAQVPQTAPEPATLVVTTAEAAGEHCAAGGLRITAGPDRDGSGVLDDAEVAVTTYECASSRANERLSGGGGCSSVAPALWPLVLSALLWRLAGSVRRSFRLE